MNNMKTLMFYNHINDHIFSCAGEGTEESTIDPDNLIRYMTCKSNGNYYDLAINNITQRDR